MPVTFTKKVIPIQESFEGGLPGCKYIYAPKGQAGEYAPLAANPYKGCGHKCNYCYVPLITHQDRKEFDAGAVPRKMYLENLKKDALKYQKAGIKEQVMMSFTTDVYGPVDTSITRQTIETIRDHGLGFCPLTKGGKRSLADFDLFRSNRDAYACTITSLDDQFAAKWERGAAPSSERVEVLKKFHEAGIFTWVSLEPTLSIEASLAIVKATHSFVNLYKVGRVNYIALTETTDWKDYTHRMIDLLAQVGAKHYIKKDLQPYLPAGYHNPLRVRQYHA